MSSGKPAAATKRTHPEKNAARAQQPKKPNSNAPINRRPQPPSMKGQPAAETKPQRWVVVIHNVENEFSRIHQEAVERYCSLNPAMRDGRSARYASECVAVDHDDTPSDENARRQLSSSLPRATYLVKPRQETRSVEVKIYAKEAQADVSSIWLPVSTTVSRKSGKPQAAPMTGSNAGAAEAGLRATDSNVAVGDEVPTSAASASGAAPKRMERLTPRYAAVSDMISVLKYKPYFSHPPIVMVGPASLEQGTGDGESVATNAAPSSRTQKRPRDADAEALTGAEGSMAGRRVLDGIRQSSLVTASVVSSSHTTTRNLKRVLSEIPGFVSCWALHALTFRVVFCDEEALFGAKLLLDQFEAEGLRLTIQLHDAAQKRFEEFAERQGEAVE